MAQLTVKEAGDTAATLQSLDSLEALKARIETECAPGGEKDHLLYWLEGQVTLAKKGWLGKAIMSPENIAARLEGEYGYSPKEAAIGGAGLCSSGATRSLMDAQEAWWYDGKFVDFEAHGESLRRLTEEKGYTLPAALWLMGYLLCTSGVQEIAPMAISGDPFGEDGRSSQNT